MDRATLHKELKAIVATLLEIDDFGDEQHFVRDLRADSMLMVELAATVEKRYRIKFPDQEMREVRNLNDAVRVTSRLLQVP
jgi:acyl carrier protein